MSCYDTYAKIPKIVPKSLAEARRTDTGHGNLDMILKVRAANFWHESLTTLTEAQLQSYCKNMIDYAYPNLQSTNLELYRRLTFQDPEISIETALVTMYNYQWWLGFVIGPNSCTRDIAYANELLNLTPNEEWSAELEGAIHTFQIKNRYIEEVTGYACCETIKRLRLLEGGA